MENHNFLIWFNCRKCNHKIDPIKLDTEFKTIFTDFYEESFSEIEMLQSDISDMSKYIGNLDDDNFDDVRILEELDKAVEKLKEVESKICILENIDYEYINGETVIIQIKDELRDYKFKNRLELPYSYLCPNCHFEINVTLYGDHYYTSGHNYVVYKSFESRNLALQGIHFTLVLGIKIKEAIEFLLRYWGINQRKIYFVSPFLNFHDWFNLAYMYKIMRFWWRKPNFKLATREKTADYTLNNLKNRHYKEELTVEEKIEDFLDLTNQTDYIMIKNNEFKKETQKSSKKEDLQNIIDPIFGIQRRVSQSDFLILLEEVVKNRLICKSKFHAKFYAAHNEYGSSNEVQILNTSYNYLISEERQYETFSFINLSLPNFETIMNSFI